LESQRENEDDQEEQPEEKPEDEEAEKKEEDDAPPVEKKVHDNKPIQVKVDGESDDDFEFIDIKEKIKAYVQTYGKDKRIPDDLINEAVRWRLNRNDC